MARLHIFWLMAAVVSLAILGFTAPALADEVEADDARHAGYYYPEPTVVEAYKPRSRILDDSDRNRRVGFVTLLTARQLASSPPRIAIFAKGAEAEKLIIVSLHDDFMDTV